MTAKQAQYLHRISPELLFDHLTKSINGPIEDSETKVYPSTYEFCFSNTENCKDPENCTGIHKRILDEIVALKRREKLESNKNPEDRKKFLQQFMWENSLTLNRLALLKRYFSNITRLSQNIA